MALIINGDDFGLNESCSKAIAKALSEELITHTTMMATGEYFDEAVKLATEQSFLDKIGIHFNLTEGIPLTSEMKNTPAFVRNGLFHKDYLNKPAELTEREKAAVIAEFSAQAERIKAAGIPAKWADSHHYIHNLINIAPLFSIVCKRYGITRVRLNRTFDTVSSPMATVNKVENSWWKEQGFITTSYFGRMSDLAQVKAPETTEIMVHPDLDKDGALIDRRGVNDGYPFGDKLINIRAVFQS